MDGDHFGVAVCRLGEQVAQEVPLASCSAGGEASFLEVGGAMTGPQRARTRIRAFQGVQKILTGGAHPRLSFGRQVLKPAVKRAGLGDITFHGLRPASSPSWSRRGNLREVSEWAGHNSVAFTLTRTAACSRTARRRRLTGWTRCWAG